MTTVYTERESTNKGKKMTNIKEIIQKAQVAGAQAAAAKRLELQAAGPRYGVVNAATGRSEGTLNDLCGFAYLYVPAQKGFSRKVKVVKELIAERQLGFDSYRNATVIRLPFISQEISVNEAGAYAAQEILKQAGLNAYVESRLD